jgi:PAS domain S-box-containing protein
LIVLLISIIFFNYRLRKGRKSLEIEVKERISVEEALREKGYIIESASSVIATADLEGNMTYANPAFLKTWGFDDTEEFLGRPFSEFWVVEDRLDEIMEALRGKGTWFSEIQARRKDGTLFDVQISSAMVFDRKDNPIALTFTSTDITERKQAEDALFKQQYFLQKAQEIGHIGTWELDIKKNELLWTDENYRIFGLPIGTELTYETFLNCVHPDDREYVDTEWKAAFNKKPYDIEHRLLVDGKVKWVREKAKLEFNEKDECIRGIGFTQDITERKKMEEELEQHRYRLEEKVRERTTELQTIVGAMSGREVRMAELKETIKKLRAQLESAELTPMADDPLLEISDQ